MYEKPGEAAVHGLEFQPLLRYRSVIQNLAVIHRLLFLKFVAYLLLPCVFQSVEVKFTVRGFYYFYHFITTRRLMLSLHLSVRKQGASLRHHG